MGKDSISSEGSPSQQDQIVRLHLGPLYTLSTDIPDGCNAVVSVADLYTEDSRSVYKIMPYATADSTDG